jgi:moderate conductance mechanosensitive channel
MVGRARISDSAGSRHPGCGLALALIVLAMTAVVPAAAAPNSAGPAKGAADPHIEQLIRTIENPAERARFITALQAAAAAKPGASVPTGSAAAAAGHTGSQVPQLIDSLGAHFLATLSSGVAWFGEMFDATRSGVRSPAEVAAAIGRFVANPTFRAAALSLLSTLVAALVLGLGAASIVGRALRGVRRRIAGTAAPGILHRLLGSAVVLVADLAEIAVLAAVASAAVALIRPDYGPRLCVLAVVNALIVLRLGLAAGRFLLAPLTPSRRLLPLGDEAAAYLTVWLRRLLVTAVWGYYALEVALVLGIDAALYAFAVKLLGLLIAAMLAVLLMQNRRPVARRLAPPEGKEASGAWALLRGRAAGTWHVFALGYLAAAYVVWASEVPGGFAYLARAAVLSVLILVVARSVAAVAQRGLTHLLRINRNLIARNPLVERRANRYVPALRYAIDAAIWFAAIIALLAAWEVDVGAVFANPVVAQILARLVAAAIIVVVALVIWEATDLAITMYLERKDDAGSSLVRSARIRTLLPLVRNVVLVVVALLALLTILSQLGINIAPLLAGAGVVGLAVGFGSQALVKDVITGAFILLEDTVNVGDVATVNGTGGLVEAITIRVIRLRGLDGTVHTIPFGSVTAISNMTKDYSMYLLDIGVAYKENTDRVIEAMQEVFADIAADPAYAGDIIGDLEVLGVDRFADSAVYVRARIKTVPIKQWNVGREYNRRMKLKFDELGIEIPFPHRTIYFGQPAEGQAAEVDAEPRRALTARAG